MLAACITLVFSSFALARADESGQKDFYKKCLLEKVAQCRRKAEALSHCKSSKYRDFGVEAKNQEAFYQENMDKLIQKMADQNVAPKEYKVSYFLIGIDNNSTRFAKSQ